MSRFQIDKHNVLVMAGESGRALSANSVQALNLKIKNAWHRELGATVWPSKTTTTHGSGWSRRSALVSTHSG